MAVKSNSYTFRSVFKNVITYTGALTIGSTGAGSGTAGTATITIPGARLGDFVLVSLSVTLNTGGTTVNDGTALTGFVSANDTVIVAALNNDGTTNVLPAAVVRIAVLQPDAAVFLA